MLQVLVASVSCVDPQPADDHRRADKLIISTMRTAATAADCRRFGYEPRSDYVHCEPYEAWWSLLWCIDRQRTVVAHGRTLHLQVSIIRPSNRSNVILQLILIRIRTVLFRSALKSGTNKVLRPNQIRAVLGLYRISEFSGNRIDPVADPAYEVGIRTIVPHPGYNCGKTSNDIALLEVTERIYFTPTVRPICLSSGSDASARVDGLTATVAGWGWQQENRNLGDKADTLQRALVDVFRNEECESMYRRGNRSRTIARTQLCAGKSVGGVDACWADSGGPLVTSNNVLIGIVSTGIGCARPGFPGIYTRVSEYAGWIVTVIERFNAS
ncbi:serine protease hepsin isoform X1 [Anopheles darlingi]|uniref:serine protease hepsin isoform X1 n=1 Tax=Anopheles darlingi TaxID=43151 RepID=UPI0021006510|nr:serine protease hepsin isoform X1 [Anopheles darlingi]